MCGDELILKRRLESESEVMHTKKVHINKGIAQLKSEYIVCNQNKSFNNADIENNEEEGSDRFMIMKDSRLGEVRNRKTKKRGQNKNRDNSQQKEEKQLCSKLVYGFQEEDQCSFGTGCKFIHDIGEYLSFKSAEIQCQQFSICPAFESLGRCPMGFKCMFLSTHFNKEELKLKTKSEEECRKFWDVNHEVNHISRDKKFDLNKCRFPFEKSDFVLDIIDAMKQELHDETVLEKQAVDFEVAKVPQIEQREKEYSKKREKQKMLYLKYRDTRYFAQEKKPLDFYHKKILSPLTTVGNLPYRRLMHSLGADITYSEMILAVPLIQGTNSEWALPRAHCSEVPGFGVQIASSKPWSAAKATEALIENVGSGLSEINLNCGCPIDLLYKQGSGSALLENPARMIRCLNAMNYVSGDIPITVKLRTGIKENQQIAHKLCRRLVIETDVAGITLHGRTRQQRYTKSADWKYIGEVANAVREYEVERTEKLKESREGKTRIQFIGNGDCNNWQDWYSHLENKNIDSVMLARGALIKPWVFEEIDARQYLDKSSTERLEILRNYAKFAMEHWGTDEYGISQCRRFFCEFMSFFHRYIPLGICERYPVLLNEKAPNWKGRNDLETLMGSTDVNNWIKLSDLFFGKASEKFVFLPKHKSNSYVVVAAEQN